MSKKGICLAIIVVLLLGIISGCGSSNDESNKQLNISTWGLNEDKLWENVFKPFEEKYGVKIVLEIGNNSERLTKIKNNPNHNIDIVYLAESFAQDGIDSGLFEEIDYSRIPNKDNLNNKVMGFVEKGFGPAYTMNRVAIAYDPSKVDFEIKSWEDLWNPKLKGKISIPDISTTFGPSIMYMASQKAGIDIENDNGIAAFEELEALKPNIAKTYSKSSDLVNMFSSGEIAVAVAADFVVANIKNAVPEIVYVDPVEGAYLNFNTINIVKGSKNKDLALDFINFALSEEVQTRNAKTINEAPVNTKVELTPEESKDITYGKVVENSNTIDFNFVNNIMPEWVDKWNKIINQ